MAQVELTIGGRSYDLLCRDGEEGRLRMLARMVDQKTVEAGRAVGDANEPRQLLMAALLLADELSDLREATPDRAAADTARVVDALARRLELLAQRLENEAGPS